MIAGLVVLVIVAAVVAQRRKARQRRAVARLADTINGVAPGVVRVPQSRFFNRQGWM